MTAANTNWCRSTNALVGALTRTIIHPIRTIYKWPRSDPGTGPLLVQSGTAHAQIM